MKVLENWDMKTTKVEELKAPRNPFSRSREWIVDNEYLLKYTKFRPKPLDLPKEIPHVKFIGKTVEKDGFYQLFPFIEAKAIDYKKTETAEQLGNIIGHISSIKSKGYKPISEKIDNIKCCVKPSVDFDRAYAMLENRLFPYLPYMELRFSHGDFHPANILMQNSKVEAVIDWEVAGMREELYDLAFLLGCMGMDHPNNLKGGFAKKLIQTVRSYKPTKLVVSLLPEMMLATRLAWLFIWQQRDEDIKIEEQEQEYIRIIMDNLDDLRRLWLGFAGEFKYSAANWVMQDAHLVEEINKAKERMKGKNLDNLRMTSPEELSTDLRLMAIDYGMHDDVTNVLKVLELQKLISGNFQENRHVQIERGLTMGNASLDISKFRLDRGAQHLKKQYSEHARENDIDEVKIGYAFLLRNTSIQAAELGNLEQAYQIVDEQIRFASEHKHEEVQGELARTLSNAITSALMVSKADPRIKEFYEKLEKLHSSISTDKVKVAHKVAETNLKKAGVLA